jgi:MFS family permease
VLFPTLIGVVSRNVDEPRRGRATSVVTTVSYLGFLLGPVYVGLWADTVGLRPAMLAVAALTVGLFVLAPPLLRLSGFDDPDRHRDGRKDEAARPIGGDHRPTHSLEEPDHGAPSGSGAICDYLTGRHLPLVDANPVAATANDPYR